MAIKRSLFTQAFSTDIVAIEVCLEPDGLAAFEQLLIRKYKGSEPLNLITGSSLSGYMSAHNTEVAKKFYELCDWLLQVWQMRKLLFDENREVAALKEPRHAHFFYRLQEILQENWLHQLAKLNDSAVQGGQKGHFNLSIEYMVEYGQWDEATKTKLLSLQAKLSQLAKPVKMFVTRSFLITTLRCCGAIRHWASSLMAKTRLTLRPYVLLRLLSRSRSRASRLCGVIY